MMLDDQQLQALLRLKRFEQPPPEYFDQALEEFHRRQRTELLKHSAFRICYDRFVSGLWSLRLPAYAYGAAFGLFAIVVTLIGTGIWIGNDATNSVNSASANHSINQAAPTVASRSGNPRPSLASVNLPQIAPKLQNLTRHLARFAPEFTPQLASAQATLELAPNLQPSSISQPRYILDGRPLAQQASFNF
jgi:hypothetical protein